VKGSQDGGWGLIQSYKKGREYHEAIDFWAARHSAKVVFCFVQFKDTILTQCPRVYLARVREVAETLKQSRNGQGNTTLLEHWSFKKGVAAGSIETIPGSWVFTADRVSELLRSDA
jgi:hypothetical protein